MKIANIIACVIVSIDCVEKALGVSPQYLVPDGYRWIWAVIAAAWISLVIENIRAAYK